MTPSFWLFLMVDKHFLNLCGDLNLLTFSLGRENIKVFLKFTLLLSNNNDLFSLGRENINDLFFHKNLCPNHS